MCSASDDYAQTSADEFEETANRLFLAELEASLSRMYPNSTPEEVEDELLDLVCGSD